MSALPAADSAVVLLAITNGGPRKHALLSAFERRHENWSLDVARKAFGEATQPPVDGFELRFVDAVQGEAAKNRAKLEAFAGDVLDDFGLDDSQRDAFGACAAAARPGNRRVLGCLLANLRAMRIAAPIPNAIVVEDNVRPAAGAGARCAAALAGGECADLSYFGHLAHDDTLAAISALPRDGRGFVATPAPRDAEGAGAPGEPRRNHELWGTFAYRVSPRLYAAVVAHVTADFPASLFRMRRRDCDVVAVDKLIQRVARKVGLTVRALAPPALFRMPPALPSKIHRKWDAPFLNSTTDQLRLYGSSWAAVWLTPEERGLAEAREAALDAAAPRGQVDIA